MRAFLIVPFCLAAAACSGGDDTANQAAAAPAALPAGTWQAQFEVTRFASKDNATTPALKAKQGDKEQDSTCIPQAQSAQPAPELFAGNGYSCTYQNSYIRDGTINATIQCTRPELKGEINMAVQGTYDGKSLEATVDSTSYLPGPGDFIMTRKLKAKLTPGACQPAPAATADNGTAAQGSKPKGG